ncbi:Nn.00g095640.m01.CDS01 [Neocucurbitaria sp. VM-36]
MILEMGLSIERPQTPPSSYLITPPSTGGFDKHVQFADEIANITSRHLSKVKEGESLTTFFEEPQEGSDAELSDISEEETISTENTPCTTPSSTISVTPKSIVLEQYRFASLVTAIDAPTPITGPFPFMKLPLSIRNKIFEHLLVVPALICVRQKHTSFHDEKKAFLYAERREYLPGIAYALAQLTVDGYKTRLARFKYCNINVLRVSKEVHTEARAILYGKNAFEIVKPTNELSPPPDFSVRPFPLGCQRLITKLNIRMRSFYDLHWILSGGYNVMRNYYRGLDTLTLILEMDAANKGFGKDIFGGTEGKKAKVIPTWMDLRVLFNGESYDENLCAPHDSTNATGDKVIEQTKRAELKHGLVEAWELFKKGGK